MKQLKKKEQEAIQNLYCHKLRVLGATYFRLS